MTIRDRIIDFRRVKAASLVPNPRNWRTHPESQASALRAMLDEVGIVGALLVRETPDGLQIIDGHLRAETLPEAEVPVLVLDLDDAEADKVLATFDPIGAMAEADQTRLNELIAVASFESEDLQRLLADLAGCEEASAIDVAAESSYAEQFGVIIICPDEAAQKETYEQLTAAGYECKVVVT